MNRIGSKAPISRHFPMHKPQRLLKEIEADNTRLEGEIMGFLKGLFE